MKLNIYTIFDIKAKLYNKPFYMLNDQVAERTARDLLNDEKSDINKHPEDFVLYKIGEYDDNTGIITTLQLPDMLFRFVDMPREEFTPYKLTEAGEQHS
jgi:hypothetical protein